MTVAVDDHPGGRTRPDPRPPAHPRLAGDRRRLPADVHGHPRQPGDDHRAARGPRRPRRLGRRAVLVRERLHAQLRDVHAAGRHARRPDGPPPGDDRRRRRLHAGLHRGRAEHLRGGADRGSRGPGAGRGRDHAALPEPARLGGAREQAGRRHRHLGWRLRPRRRSRPGDRRRRRRRGQLAGDLLAERARRASSPCRSWSSRSASRGAPGSASTRSARCCSAARCSSGSGASCTATTTAGPPPA